MSQFAWTDAAAAMLKKLVEDGHSFSAIAEMLHTAFPKDGDLTRNSCIGKASRMGFVAQTKKKVPRPARSNNTRPPVIVGRFKKPQASKDRAELARIRMADFEGALSGEAAPIILKGEQPARRKATEPAPPTAPEVLGPEGGIGFFDMHNGLCKFPLNAISKPGERSFDMFRACGAPSPQGQPYCVHHHRVAYHPAQPRRRREDTQRGFSVPKTWIDA